MSTDKLWEFQNICREIINCGCCLRCAVRYLNTDFYDKPAAGLATIGVHVDDEFIVEMRERRPCCVCLGCLDDSVFEDVLTHVNLQEVQNFTSESFQIHVRLPVVIPVRDKSMLLHLKEKFPQFEISRLFVEKTFRRVLIKPFEQMFNKIHDKDSRLGIYIDLQYDTEFNETKQYRKLRTGKTTRKRQSKNGLLLNMKQCSFERMKQIVPVPPEAPPQAARFYNLTVRVETFHITGRYRKFSRNLPQYVKNNPNGNSIEKIVVDALTTVLGPAQYIFKAIGHDDSDDRVLENGRLFSVQLIDTNFTTINYKQFEMIENLIKDAGIVEVVNFHNISRKYLGEIVESEKLQNTHLRIFCRLMVKDVNVCIDKINRLGEIQVTQRTPIRLLHDRDVDEVTKIIFTINSAPLENHHNLIQIEIEAQRGLHFREFIHGDLGRTIPNLCDLLEEPVEFVATDFLI